MSSALHTCSVCSSAFEMRFAYQMQKQGDQILRFCSQSCHERHLFSADLRQCSVCPQQFELKFAYQQLTTPTGTHFFCSTDCRERATRAPEARPGLMRCIAIQNQKGGVGKTTTSVNVAAGLADAGFRTLLVDLDSQGNVAVSLGLNAPKTVTEVLLGQAEPAECIVNVGPNLDALASNNTLASAEIQLVNMRDRHKILRHRMRNVTGYDYIILDCGPSLSVLNQNALVYADHLVIPVSCDYLSLVGVRQILKTLRHVNDILLHPVSVLGVVPTLFDVRTKSSTEALRTLASYFKGRVLPAVRVNNKLREAPSHKKTIFEFAPDSHGAEDYRSVVAKLLELADSATQGGGEADLEQSGT